MNMLVYRPFAAKMTGSFLIQDHPANRTGGGPEDKKRQARPRVDIIEGEQEFLLQADVPGLSREELRLEVEDGKLTLEAGGYERVFVLPDEVEAGRIGAALADGVLTVTLPKAGPEEPRRIAVTVN